MGAHSYRLEESKQVNQEIRFAIPEIMDNSQTKIIAIMIRVNFNIFNSN